MTKATLLADAIAWLDEDGVRQEADGRGTEVDLPKEAFDRHEAAGNIAAAGSKAASSTASASEDEASVLMDANNRGALDEMAKAAGVENPEGLENKRAVAEAIVAARG